MQSKQETTKPAYNIVIRRFCLQWSEMGDSNSRHLAPKASALPTALIPDFWLLSFAPDVVKHVVRRFFWPPRLAEEVPVSQAYQGIAYTVFSGLKGEHPAPKPMSKPSGRTVSHSLALSGTPAVPLWNSIGLFISATAFGFWDLCGIEFCILKVLPTGFTSNSGCFLPQRAAQKLRRINKEISAGVILPTLSINGKWVVVAKTPSENVQTKKKLAHFLWFLHRAP